jgi:hypothetical protein
MSSQRHQEKGDVKDMLLSRNTSACSCRLTAQPICRNHQCTLLAISTLCFCQCHIRVHPQADLHVQDPTLWPGWLRQDVVLPSAPLLPLFLPAGTNPQPHPRCYCHSRFRASQAHLVSRLTRGQDMSWPSTSLMLVLLRHVYSCCDIPGNILSPTCSPGWAAAASSCTPAQTAA